MLPQCILGSTERSTLPPSPPPGVENCSKSQRYILAGFSRCGHLVLSRQHLNCLKWQVVDYSTASILSYPLFTMFVELFVYCSRAVVEDGGLYMCTARNRAGEVKHAARLNIYGQ